MIAIVALELQLQEGNCVRLFDADPIAVAFLHQRDTAHPINIAVEPNDAHATTKVSPQPMPRCGVAESCERHLAVGSDIYCGWEFQIRPFVCKHSHPHAQAARTASNTGREYHAPFHFCNHLAQLWMSGRRLLNTLRSGRSLLGTLRSWRGLLEFAWAKLPIVM